MSNKILTAADLRFNPPSFPKQALQREVKKVYGLSGTLKPLAGERDQNHLLTTADQQKYIVKVAGPHEDRSAVDYQIKTLLHIEGKNPALNIPRNLKTLVGDDFAIIKSASGQEHMMRLLNFIDGVPFGEAYKPPLHILEDAGRFQGQMCVALADFSHPSEGYFMPWDTSQGLILNPALRSSKYGDVERLITPLMDHFRDHVLPTLNSFRKQTIHNDAHNDNVLRSSSKSDDFYGVIDFGDICYAPVIQDLSIPMIGYVGDVINPIENGSAYVRGFASAHPLTPEGLDILYDLLLLRASLTVQLIDFRIQNDDANMQGLVEEYPMLVKRLESLLSIDRVEITNAFHQAHKEGISQ